MTTIQNSVDNEKTIDTRLEKQNNHQNTVKMHAYLTSNFDNLREKASDAFFYKAQ